MTKVVFETAGLADALKEASAASPTRGEAFDKAAGIVLEVQKDVVLVKATNLKVWYTQWVTPLEVVGPPVSWRLPAKTLTDVVTKLDLSSSKRFILEQSGNAVKMTHGRKRGQFLLMQMDSYPDWSPFDPEGLTEVPEMATQISRVDWAADKGNVMPFIGVHFDGELAIATDRYRFAVTPLKILELHKPVTIPSGLLSGLIRTTDSVMMRVTEYDMQLMPDENTQVRSLILGVPYPNVMAAVSTDYPETVTIEKQHLLDMIQVAASFIGSDRLPTLRVFFGKEKIAIMMANQEIGHLGDILEVPGQATHETVEIKFNPKNLMDALEKAPSSQVTLGYDPGNLNGAFYVKGGEGCDFWLSPKRDVIPSDA